MSLLLQLEFEPQRHLMTECSPCSITSGSENLPFAQPLASATTCRSRDASAQRSDILHIELVGRLTCVGGPSMGGWGVGPRGLHVAQVSYVADAVPLAAVVQTEGVVVRACGVAPVAEV